jgi:hypothetical protein
MKEKWPLFTGVVFLTLGVILLKTIDFDPWSLIILLTGVAFKVAYILSKIIKKEYIPGYEIAFLLIGLSLFLGGIILEKKEIIENAIVLKMVGISLKVVFIFAFIKKSRKK